MNYTVGYIPYLNMVPFHQGFGPQAVNLGADSVEFKTVSPHALGLEAENGSIHAGAMSLIDSFRLSEHYQPLGNFGIGVKHAAGSVLLFSNKPLAQLEGICAVTDETSTSVRLLQVLLEKRYSRGALNYGRIAAGMYDGSADALLLIGDTALEARRDGVKGLPVVTDLAAEWAAWQGVPFVFARWVIRRDIAPSTADIVKKTLDESLFQFEQKKHQLAAAQSLKCGLPADQIISYWDGFDFRLTPAHEQAISRFREFTESECLTA